MLDIFILFRLSSHWCALTTGKSPYTILYHIILLCLTEKVIIGGCLRRLSKGVVEGVVDKVKGLSKGLSNPFMLSFCFFFLAHVLSYRIATRIGALLMRSACRPVVFGIHGCFLSFLVVAATHDGMHVSTTMQCKYSCTSQVLSLGAQTGLALRCDSHRRCHFVL